MAALVPLTFWVDDKNILAVQSSSCPIPLPYSSPLPPLRPLPVPWKKKINSESPNPADSISGSQCTQTLTMAPSLPIQHGAVPGGQGSHVGLFLMPTNRFAPF